MLCTSGKCWEKGERGGSVTFDDTAASSLPPAYTREQPKDEEKSSTSIQWINKELECIYRGSIIICNWILH